MYACIIMSFPPLIIKKSIYCIPGKLRDFYRTPIKTTVPLDTMRSMDLPKNLHVEYEYHRYHPGW